MSRRYFVPSLPPIGRSALPDAVVRHLAVLRVRPGDAIVLFDGCDHEATARILSFDRRRIEVEVESLAEVVRGAGRHVELAVALPRGTRAEWLFEHATELGVARFRPVVFARSRDGGAPDRRERWLRIVIAASEQCDRSSLPAVDAERPLAAVLADPALPAHRDLALPGAPEALQGPTADAAVLCVGPEGGFTVDEVEQLVQAGFRPRSLGPLTLRTETAALVGAARLLS